MRSHSRAIPDLESLNGADYHELLKLHGVGKAGLRHVHDALVERGMGLTGDIPKAPGATWTKGHTGENAKDIKTAQTEQDPARWLETLEWSKRTEQGKVLLELFTKVTGVEGVMWGPSMIGFGEVHYRYATGREGDTFHVGFSPRKASLSLYGLQGYPRSEELLAKLGKHKLAKSCVYVNKLEDIDLEVVAELIKHAWDSDPGDC
ncbi:DUF1801 domain-containing protein [Flaviflexus massiliensis]|uniref:DUF1801 domain-containing protein n=1 Tax=Flaviflexus massiliensis TaxID=1522309 RepID=UPI000B095E18|nr:DUF1801 domain-containing protein [Flaviflexus massiliensis]